MKSAQFSFSEEPYVQQWVEKFAEADRKIITLFLTQLLLVPVSKFLRSIDTTLSNERERLLRQNNFTPIVILPVIKTSKRSIFCVPSNYSARSKQNIKLHLTSDKVPEIIQYSNNYRDPGIGSEALLANLITTCHRKWRKEIVINPTINKMKKLSVHNMYFLDDLVGSGDRFISFYNKVIAHPTIKSWKSSKYINFTLVCYSITEEAFQRIKALNSNIRILYDIKCPTIDNITSLTKEQKQLIEKTCKKYSKNFHDFALGYRNSKVLLVFEHSVPNNLPGILFKKINKQIPALFPNQVIPHDLKKSFIDIESPVFLEKFKSYFYMIRKRIIIFVDKKNANRDFTILAILDAISKGYRRIESLSNILLLDQNEMRENLSFLKRKSLIDENNNLTIIGKNTLRKLGKEKNTESNQSYENYINYIPKSFGGQ
ncbi:hypothetical protein JWG44_09695 [Leptospira sp. 201903071]|uniref:phosphoribosyltransferase-like protein n=1 Tax=Leptospira ainazelensis TaxID=2810034 RepID=UPI0019665B6B|nr:hypothetical protein [Leptospira ainazelensis]MBM9500519.1 hypothetical protein [Leptospira ainazelensis]